MFTPEQTIRLYVCSSPDMPAERAYLHQVLCPRLRAFLQEHGLGLEVQDFERLIDLEPAAERTATLPRRLEEIDRCRPLFLALLGERYGPILPPLPEEALRRYPWLRERTHCSRLHLELVHGVLSGPPQPVPAIVCLRNASSLADVPEPQRHTFREEDSLAAEKLAALKQTLRGSPSVRLIDYTCHWDPPTNSLADFTALGEQLLAALLENLRVLLPALNLGRGNWGIVYSAGHEALPRLVAVKLLPREEGAPDAPPQPATGEAGAGPRPALYLDDNVQFTVFRPRAVVPNQWYPFLAFAHLSERPPEAAPEDPDPIEEVQRQAGQVLGALARDYQDVTQDSRLAVPREGEISFVPEVKGIEFNPPRRTFRWQESVHREEFRMRASAALEGRVVRGRLTVFLGSILLADVALSIRVDSRARHATADPPEVDREAARPYRKIFASYSHRDLDIVRQVENYARMLGDRYLRDWTELRAGEVWNERLMELIEEADVFQLFWSSNSMHSPYVRREWEHALKLNRPHFIRPTYWEEPLPEVPEKDLPPEALRRLHFQRLLAAEETHPPLRHFEPVTVAAEAPSVERPRAVTRGLDLPASTPDSTSPPPAGLGVFFCSFCGQMLRVPDHLQGERAHCPSCGRIVTVPRGPTPTERPAALARAPRSSAVPDRPRRREAYDAEEETVAARAPRRAREWDSAPVKRSRGWLVLALLVLLALVLVPAALYLVLRLFHLF